MIEFVDVNKIKGAKYNPRKISDKQIDKLKESILNVGMVVPVLVNKKNNIIVAGHQRTKTAKLIGLEKIPVIFVEDMEIGDEIKFNQIHNITDKTLHSRMFLQNDTYDKESYVSIDNSDITEAKVRVTCVKEICKLILKYGNVLSCVICRNEILVGREYVKACKLLNLKVNAYICDDDKYELISYYFEQQYGEYCYDNLEKKTYVQGLAQMYRSVEKKEGKRANKSKLYETMVFPYLIKNPNSSVLDFGCGKGAYINELKRKHVAIGLEFYNNNGRKIDVQKGHAMIDELIEYLKLNKSFDVVVCDSVLNSVDSMKAEFSIYALLNLMTRKKLFISGRTLKFINDKFELKRSKDNLRYIEFLDENNFSANYRRGQWYYQHFHEEQTVKKYLRDFGFEIVKSSFVGSSFQIECNKVKELDDKFYIDAIDFEFNLPLPNGKSYNRNDDVKRVFGYVR